MNHLSLRFAPGALLISALGLVACGGDSGGSSGMPDAGGTVTGTPTHYVTSSLKMGTSPSEASGYAFDLDGMTGKDNVLGGILAGLNSQLMVDMAISSALTAGDFVILHSLKASSLTSASSATWQVLLGDSQMMPKLDGTGSFTVSASSPTNSIISGTIVDGKFSGGPAQVALQLALIAGQQPLRVTVNATRLEAMVTPTGCTSGRIGGAIKSTELISNVVPVLATTLDDRLKADPACANGCNCSVDANKLICNFFDVMPKDGRITTAEIQSNILIQAIFTPDVDVLKADGTPGTDGVKESVSLALGFTCAKGTFTVSGE